MKKIGLLILPIVTILLEALPYGAVLVFASSPTERIRRTCSYFSLTPFGFANFAPLITAVLTCVILLLAMLSIKSEKARKAVFGLSLATAIISLLPLVYGVEFYSMVGGMITLTLAAECVLAKMLTK